MSIPTQRQLGLIAEMQEVTGVEFTGDTKAEASVYIDENLDDFRLMQDLEGIELESQHGDYGCLDD